MASRERQPEAPASGAETVEPVDLPTSDGAGGIDGELAAPVAAVDADVAGLAEAGQSPPSELEQLRAQLEVEQARGDELLRQVADARNEMEAVQRRAEQQMERSRRHQLAEFMSELPPVLDGLRLAVDTAAAVVAAGAEVTGEAIEPLVEGIRLTRRNLLELLQRNGLKELDPQGQVFDPLFHEAIASVAAEDPSVVPHTVMQVVQRGYTLHDRLLRAARVVVTAPSVLEDEIETAVDGGSEHTDSGLEHNETAA